jgi:sugar phosphate isomerase/epimerase
MRNLPRTLAAIRQFGYEGVEFAGFYGWRAADIRKLLQGSSLTVCGSHTPLDQLSGSKFTDTVAFNREIGNRNLILPGLPSEYQSVDDWIHAAALLNELADRLQPFGMRIGYHNHAVEFQRIGTQRPWDLLFSRTRSSVIMQVDLGNARIGGADPIALLRRYPGRAWSVHVKDYREGEPDVMLGSSDFDWPMFCQTCKTTAGTRWYIIEHESRDVPSLMAANVYLKRFKQLCPQ